MSIRLSRAPLLAFALVVASCSDAGLPAPVPSQPLFTLTPLPPVRISEFHYDNTGTDAGEAIEISAPVGTSFAGWSIVLYNGANGLVYDTDALPLTAPTVCPDGLRQVVFLAYPSNGIQNGSPDGIALVGPSGVGEFLSYEGVFAAVGGPASGMLSTDVGVFENGSEPLGQSLKRNGFGAWSPPSPASFGACNDEDPPPPPPIASITVTPSNATIVQGATRQFTATAFDADDVAIPGVTFDWSSDNETVATVSATGLATGQSPGDAGISATAGGASGLASLHVDAPSVPTLPGSAHIVEIHYDNGGADAGEAIEVEGPAGTSPTGWSLVLYNGNGGASYGTLPITGTFADQCGGRGVLTIPAPGLQNGAPDGIALLSPSGVEEFLSYEGTFSASNGPATGQLSVDIGVDEDGGEPLGRSLQKFGAAWYGPVASTFAACNPPPPPPSMAIFGRSASADPPLPVGFQAQLFGEIRDASGNVIETPITWSADTPALVSVDTDGVITALGEGTAIIRATGDDGTTETISLPTRVATQSTTAQYAGNAEFGEPADGDARDDFIVRYAQYTASFNPHRGTPNWVSYNLEATHFGPEDRCECFTFDPSLPASFPRYTTADYTGARDFHGFGIDRGHMARSVDRTAGSLDNANTFLFTNIVPQTSAQNQGPWALMENDLGAFARDDNKEVYIVAGVAGNQGTVKGEGKVTIPTHTWKVAVILPRDHGLADVASYHDAQVIAVIMPNLPVVNSDWHTYETTVEAVEALSGYDLLALLPDEIEVAIETGLGDVLDLVAQLAAGGALNAGNANSLTQKLQAAVRQLARGGSTPAVNQLEAFLNELNALVRSRRLGADEAASLSAAVTAIIQSLGPPV